MQSDCLLSEIRQLGYYKWLGEKTLAQLPEGKILAPNWTALSIPSGESGQYNAQKFAQPNHKEQFTDD